MSIINAIYKKYPCVEEFLDKDGLSLATMKEACEMFLRGKLWRKYVEDKASDKKEEGHRETARLWKDYHASFEKNGFILSPLGEYLGLINKIRKPIDRKYNPMIRDMGSLLKIKGSTSVPIETLYDKIMDRISSPDFTYEPRATDILHESQTVRTVFRFFMIDMFLNLCYLRKEDTQMRQEFADAINIFYVKKLDDSPIINMNIGEGYIQHIVDDNLAMAFPGLYRDSHNQFYKGVEPKFNPAIEVPWDQKPEFPKSAIMCIIRKSDGLLVNFVAAVKGYNTKPDVDDRDVYGQLVCTNVEYRAGGIGKISLVATILMAKQFRVNYVFIQAFQGIMAVQAPLYNRIGFELYFPHEILLRKTAFNQWANIEEPELTKEHAKYVAGEYDLSLIKSFKKTMEDVGNVVKSDEIRKKGFGELFKNVLSKLKPDEKTIDFLKRKFTHLAQLHPMWINIKDYDTQYVCDILNVSGFDYHTKTIGPMGKGGLFDKVARVSGYIGFKGKPVDHEEFKVREKQPDNGSCVVDDDCLSDFCVQGSCRPYPYNNWKDLVLKDHKKEILRLKKAVNVKEKENRTFLDRLDADLKKKGIADDDRIKKDMATARRWMIKEEGYNEEDVRAIEKEQESLRAWANLLIKKQADEKAHEEEIKLFTDRVKKYNESVKGGAKAAIALNFLKAVPVALWEMIVPPKKEKPEKPKEEPKAEDMEVEEYESGSEMGSELEVGQFPTLSRLSRDQKGGKLGRLLARSPVAKPKPMEIEPAKAFYDSDEEYEKYEKYAPLRSPRESLDVPDITVPSSPRGKGKGSRRGVDSIFDQEILESRTRSGGRRGREVDEGSGSRGRDRSSSPVRSRGSRRESRRSSSPVRPSEKETRSSRRRR
jgi:hypothetical protein